MPGKVMGGLGQLAEQSRQPVAAPQFLGRLAKGGQVAGVLIVAEGPGKLDKELKAGRRLLSEARQHLGGWQAVEGEVQFHQRKVPGVAGEHLSWPGACRVKRADPVGIRVARGTDPDLHGRRNTVAGTPNSSRAIDYPTPLFYGTGQI